MNIKKKFPYAHSLVSPKMWDWIERNVNTDRKFHEWVESNFVKRNKDEYYPKMGTIYFSYTNLVKLKTQESYSLEKLYKMFKNKQL